jgi:predicted transcriptional regulator
MPKGNTEKLKPEEVINALEETAWNVYGAAALLKVSHATVYNYLKRHKSIEKQRPRIISQRKDRIKAALWREGVIKGNAQVLLKIAAVELADEGYGNNIGISGPNGQPIQIQAVAKADAVVAFEAKLEELIAHSATATLEVLPIGNAGADPQRVGDSSQG